MNLHLGLLTPSEQPRPDPPILIHLPADIEDVVGRIHVPVVNNMATGTGFQPPRAAGSRAVHNRIPAFGADEGSAKFIGRDNLDPGEPGESVLEEGPGNGHVAGR